MSGKAAFILVCAGWVFVGPLAFAGDDCAFVACAMTRNPMSGDPCRAIVLGELRRQKESLRCDQALREGWTVRVQSRLYYDCPEGQHHKPVGAAREYAPELPCYYDDSGDLSGVEASFMEKPAWTIAVLHNGIERRRHLVVDGRR